MQVSCSVLNTSCRYFPMNESELTVVYFWPLLISVLFCIYVQLRHLTGNGNTEPITCYSTCVEQNTNLRSLRAQEQSKEGSSRGVEGPERSGEKSVFAEQASGIWDRLNERPDVFIPATWRKRESTLVLVPMKGTWKKQNETKQHNTLLLSRLVDPLLCSCEIPGNLIMN